MVEVSKETKTRSIPEIMADIEIAEIIVEAKRPQARRVGPGFENTQRDYYGVDSLLVP